MTDFGLDDDIVNDDKRIKTLKKHGLMENKMTDFRLGYRFKDGEGSFFGVNHEDEWHPLDNVNLLRLVLNLADETNDVTLEGSFYYEEYEEEKFGVFAITVNDHEYSSDEVNEVCELYGVAALIDNG